MSSEVRQITIVVVENDSWVADDLESHFSERKRALAGSLPVKVIHVHPWRERGASTCDVDGVATNVVGYAPRIVVVDLGLMDSDFDDELAHGKEPTGILILRRLLPPLRDCLFLIYTKFANQPKVRNHYDALCREFKSRDLECMKKPDEWPRLVLRIQDKVTASVAEAETKGSAGNNMSKEDVTPRSFAGGQPPRAEGPDSSGPPKAGHAGLPGSGKEGDDQAKGRIEVEALVQTQASELSASQAAHKGIETREANTKVNLGFLEHSVQTSSTVEKEHAKESVKRTEHSVVLRVAVVVVVIVLAFLGKYLYDTSNKGAPNDGQQSPEKAKQPHLIDARGAEGQVKSAVPVASWILRPGGGDQISDHVPWPFDRETKIKFRISNVTMPELSEVKLILRERQTLGSEARSGAFRDGDVLPVAGFSKGGDTTFYIVPVILPGGAAEFMRRFPAAKVEAFKAD